jgi:hypothetical protein
MTTPKQHEARTARRTIARSPDKQLISFLMKKPMLEQLNAKAEQMGVSRSALIHFAIARLLADDPMAPAKR